jgi:hypothetical protein
MQSMIYDQRAAVVQAEAVPPLTILPQQHSPQAARDARPDRQPPLKLAGHIKGAAHHNRTPCKGIHTAAAAATAASCAAAVGVVSGGGVRLLPELCIHHRRHIHEHLP